MSKIVITISLLAILILLVIAGANLLDPTEESEYQTVIATDNVDAINFPRFSDALVVYTWDVGRNEYGYELLIEKGTNFVIDRGELVDIRDNTYVISGHGDAADFLKKAQIGDIIEINLNKITIKRDHITSNIKILELDEQRVENTISDRIANLYDVDLSMIESINEELKAAKEELYEYANGEEIELSVFDAKVQRVASIIDRKSCYSMEYYSVEGRGMWHRPNASAIDETTLDGVKEFASYLYDMGINALYIETFWHGMTTHYSDYLGCQHPRMSSYQYGEYGNDYMAALISECHKLGIEVHAWVELLSVGDMYGNAPSYVKSEWLCSDLDGSHADAFIDPTNKEVRDFLCEVLGEMLEKYDFDGISYDYIRYTQSIYWGDPQDNGFTENSVALFREQYGYSGSDLISDLKNDESIRASWFEFKQNAITETVKQISNHLRSVDPEAVLSASPYGYIDDAKDYYMQDIVEWVSKGYLDVVLPMIYTEDASLLSETVGQYNDYSQMVLQYTGISPLYNGSSIAVNQELIGKIKEQNISGVSFFASQNYILYDEQASAEILDILTTTTHKGNAVTPTSDVNKVFSAWKELLLDRYDRLYKEHMAPSEIALFEDFIDNSSFAMNNPAEINDMLVLLKQLCESTRSFESAAVGERIRDQAEYIYSILDVAITRHLIRYGYWNVESTPSRPNVYSIDFSK